MVAQSGAIPGADGTFVWLALFIPFPPPSFPPSLVLKRLFEHTELDFPSSSLSMLTSVPLPPSLASPQARKAAVYKACSKT